MSVSVCMCVCHTALGHRLAECVESKAKHWVAMATSQSQGNMFVCVRGAIRRRCESKDNVGKRGGVVLIWGLGASTTTKQ